MRKNLRASILFLTISLFWGIIYPQYALTEDMYEVSCDGRIAKKDCRTDYERILSAGPGEVELHFFLLDQLKEWFGENETHEYNGK